MGFFGNLIGQGLGALGSMVLPIPGVNGAQLGGHLGGLLPFKKGGKVKVKKVKAPKKAKAKAPKKKTKGKKK